MSHIGQLSHTMHCWRCIGGQPQKHMPVDPPSRMACNCCMPFCMGGSTGSNRLLDSQPLHKLVAARRSLLSHHSSDALFRLTLDKWFSITLFGQINPNNCTLRMKIWFWSAVDNRIFQFPSPNIFVLNHSPIIDVMAHDLNE